METTYLIPTLNHIKEHFSKAKEIRCLKLNVPIDVSRVRDYQFSEEDQSWNGPAGLVCFWKDGSYAEITKKKCNPEDCRKCKECSEKRKNKKI